MFAPVAVDNIEFPTRTSLSTLDFIPESYEAYQAYTNIPTASTYTTQSILTSLNTIMRCGINDTGKIFCIQEADGGTPFIWDTNTNTSSSISPISAGTVRNVVWDNFTNSWVVAGTSAFVKVNCDTLVTASIAVPTNQGTQYPAVVAYGGKAYAAPLVSTGTNTAIAIFDLVANTATTSSVKPGTGGFWGACLTSVGTIYFARETGATNNSIYEYDPVTGTGTAFGTVSGTTGYGITNLPNGNVFLPGFGINQTVYIINPVNKSIQTIATAGFGFNSGICVGQNGHPYGIQAQATGDNGIWGFNTTTNLGYLTQYAVPRPGTSSRGFQDLFSLADGRLLAMPGQNNNGRLIYYTFLSNPANNTFSQVGAANPIITNGKGT